jgi:hypothetical protein
MDEQMLSKYGEIVAWVLATFAFLKGASTFFTFVANKTKNTWDNKVANGFAWFMSACGKIIDQFIGNSR